MAQLLFIFSKAPSAVKKRLFLEVPHASDLELEFLYFPLKFV